MLHASSDVDSITLTGYLRVKDASVYLQIMWYLKHMSYLCINSSFCDDCLCLLGFGLGCPDTLSSCPPVSSVQFVVTTVAYITVFTTDLSEHCSPFATVEKYGLGLILQPLIKELATEGITVLVNGIEKTFHGALLLCLGDNLGINTLAGFKQSFSFAFRFCRTCYVTTLSLSESSMLGLRSSDKHAKECDLLSGPLKDHYSKTYGINRRSILMDVTYFSMFRGGLPHDIMHDVLEG